MIRKIHPSMLAQLMFAILLTSLCSLPATDGVIYPLGLILFWVPGYALQLMPIWWIRWLCQVCSSLISILFQWFYCFFYWIMVRLWMCCYKCMYLLVPFVLFPPDEIRQPLPSWLNHLAHPTVLGLTNFNENQHRSCPICISFTLCLLCVDESLQFLMRQ